jgi:hypothetical protein
MAQETKREVDQIKSFLSGGFAGIASVLVGHPFYTLKVRLQTSDQYKGLADCFRQTIKREGPRGLYKGMTSPLIGVTPSTASLTQCSPSRSVFHQILNETPKTDIPPYVWLAIVTCTCESTHFHSCLRHSKRMLLEGVRGKCGRTDGAKRIT